MDIVAEQRKFRRSSPSFVGRGIERLAHPLGKFAASMVPNGLVEKVLSGLDKAVARLPSIDPADAPRGLDEARELSGKIQRRAQALNGSTGAAAGFGGILTMSADIPTTIGVALANIRQTGRAYGYEGDGPEERMLRLRVLELAATGGGDRREEIIAQIDASLDPTGGLVPMENHDISPLLDQVIERVSRALAFASAGRRAGMAVPIVGALVGGAVNASFQRDVSKAARFAYQERRLLSQSGPPERLSGPSASV
ncbi:EcsC family protein [Sphingomicrobium sp. XHP0239]|uniref:EcsC family protein n=1 Tax=Sphingomicrobium maritimum TaxID=3133972 RepID=UPI0031CC92D6